MLQFGNKNAPKYLSFVFGKEWEKGEFKWLEFTKTPLGWDFNVWRFSISYDNFEKVTR